VKKDQYFLYVNSMEKVKSVLDERKKIGSRLFLMNHRGKGQVSDPGYK